MEKVLPLEEDRALLDRFREGRPEALLAVYRLYAQRIATYLQTGLRTESGRSVRLSGAFDLEGGVQEVFVRAFQPAARASYDGLRPYEGFLVGVARNLLRERARERELPASEPLVEPAVDSGERPRLEDELELREVAALLRTFLAECTAEERQLYELRFDEGLGQEDAAKRLGLTRIQLRRRETALKRRLLERLQSGGYLTRLQAKGWGFGTMLLLLIGGLR